MDKKEECCICYEEMGDTNFTITTCGHKFHSRCIFTNLVQRVECPMCRTELVERLSVDDNDDDEDDEDDEDITEYDSDGDNDEEEIAQPLNIEQIAVKLKALGYTMEDVLMMCVGSDHPEDRANTRWYPEVASLDPLLNPVLNSANAPNVPAVVITNFDISSNLPEVGSHMQYVNEFNVEENEPDSIICRLQNDIDLLMNGKLTMSHRDSRSYASLLSNVEDV